MTGGAATIDGGVFATERLLLRNKVRILRNRLFSMRRGPLIATLAVTAFLAFFWVAGFVLLFLGLRYVNRIADLGPLLTTRLFYLFFLTLLFMLAFSNTLVALGTLFRSPEVVFLVPRPIEARRLFLARTVESIVEASWPFLFLAVPVLTAFGIVRGAGPLYYVASAILLVPYIAIAGGLGVAVAFLLAAVFPRARPWQIGSTLAVLTVAAGWFLWNRYDVRALLAGGDLAVVLERFAGAMAGVQSPWAPSTWIARGILRSAEGDIAEGAFSLLLIGAHAVVLHALLDAVAHRVFLPTWSAVQTGGWSRGPDATRRAPALAPAALAALAARASGVLDRAERPGARSARGAARALLGKDVRMFLRDPVQWGQLLLLGLLIGIYMLSLFRMPLRFPNEFWTQVTIVMNRSTAALISAIVTSRFVFPLLSLEGRHRWILELCPLDRRGLMRQKLMAGAAPTAVIAVVLLLVSELLLGVARVEIALDLIAGVAMAVALSALAVGFGAIWPNYTEDNPARLINSVGGTLTFFVSLLLIAFAIVADVGPLVLRTAGAEAHQITLALAVRTALVVLASAVLGWLALRAGRRNFERQEF